MTRIILTKIHFTGDVATFARDKEKGVRE